MTLKDIYNDVYSRLGLSGDDHSIYRKDIIKAINDSIRSTRVEYARNEVANELSVTEIIYVLLESFDYPFVNEAKLDNKIMSDLPLEYTVLGSNAYTTSNEIEDITQSFNEGDIARKENNLYECVHTFSNENNFNSTFNPREYRTYFRQNGTSYNQGEVLYDQESGDWFKVNTGFTADQDASADNITELDRLHWKEIDKSNIHVSHYSFKNIQQLRVFDSLRDSQGLTIKDDVLYCTKEIEQIILTYIPKWKNITDFSKEIDIPDFMIPKVKGMALSILAKKLNLEFQMEQRELPNIDKEEGNAE